MAPKELRWERDPWCDALLCAEHGFPLYTTPWVDMHERLDWCLLFLDKVLYVNNLNDNANLSNTVWTAGVIENYEFKFRVYVQIENVLLKKMVT